MSQLWGGLWGCRSDMWRGGVVHHGAGSTDGFLIPGCLTPWVLQQHLTSVAAGSQPPWRARLTSRVFSALQGLSALWALISEGTAARFGVAHAVQASWDTALSMLGDGRRQEFCPVRAAVGARCRGISGRVCVSSADTRQAWTGCLIKCEELSHFTSCSPHCSLSDSGKESFY